VRPPFRDANNEWVEVATPRSVHLCSNDYLGYGSRSALRSFAVKAAERAWPGATGSRLLSGEHRAHRRLEEAIARWLQVPDALVFASGYAANTGTISALAGAGDLIVSDALNHASIIDGCRLSRARVEVTPHRDVDAMRYALAAATSARRRWVITESYFSMDGDCAPLSELRALCDEYDAALIVDEAHALGVFGPQGRGLAAEMGVMPDVIVGTLGKALATQGAFVAGSSELCTWLWNRARSFVFSTGLSPLVAEISVAAVELARADDDARRELGQATVALRDACESLGLSVPRESRGPIIPVLLGSDQAAVGAAEALRARGILALAVRPPTVPEGTARLRLTASAALAPDDIARFRAAGEIVFR
jgi:8-amino-7-oxononanoate synthase